MPTCPTCPCCSDKLLRHARSSGIYWFCTSCWQEMPVFSGQPIEVASQPKCPSPRPTTLKLPVRLSV